MEFDARYKKLNDEQRLAVDTIDGPLLVLAGPGTGKTELLGMRVANILKKTDTLPQNILCLTFTESGSSNMRTRLSSIIGQQAYDVNISTYHGFGGDLIRRFPEYFTETRLQNPVDELGKREIMADIVERMSYLNPLKQTQHHLGDLIATISEVKRGLLSPESLLEIARQNTKLSDEVNPKISEIFTDFKIMPRKIGQALPYFQHTMKHLSQFQGGSLETPYQSLRDIIVSDLEMAISEANDTGKTTPLTKWKNNWLAKDKENKFILAGGLQNRRIEALADVLHAYQQALESRGLYDFDDMILRSIQALRQNADFRFTLQEQYQYILLDEFQDTNAAQFEIIKLLTDNPVHEGWPNIMAVGDDDQAIYAFQGAHYSNMIDFYQQYQNTKVVNLVKNYRSHADVLHVAHNIAGQIESRLHHHFKDMSKTLEAATTLPSVEIQRHEFLSDIAQADWIAKDIAQKIEQGISPSEIAILAPRHKYLETLVPHLLARKIPVHYEKREDILETSTIRALKSMSRLVLALAEGDEKHADSLWPEVLSYEFFEFPVSSIWQISWKVSDHQGKTSWTKSLLENKEFNKVALLFMTIAARMPTSTAETVLDYLMGAQPVEIHENGYRHLRSPMRDYYLGKKARSSAAARLYETLSHLQVIRAKFHEHQLTSDRPLLLQDFLDFIALYETSETRMVNTSPYNTARDAVELMTVFKAKGLEFEHVYLPDCVDDVWGETSRSNINKLTLPANLAPIRHAGANQDERLRIFFVAITRAKCGLYLTNAAQNYAGKTSQRLSYLTEQDGEVERDMSNAPALEILQTSWHASHLTALQTAKLRDLLGRRLNAYQLSPTHLNTFTDVAFAGPETFFFNTILRFPSTPSASGQFGNAIHETLQWYQGEINSSGKPTVAKATEYFAARMQTKRLTDEETKLLIERGEAALRAYLDARSPSFHKGNVSEYNFRNEGVFVGDVHMTGKIDLLDIDQKNKTITIVDFKTGKPHAKWISDTRLHKYRQQLYCYKLLVEGSHSFKDYKVIGGRLEFIEPDHEGTIHTLELKFDDKELEHTKQLIEVIWNRIRSLNLPDIIKYPQNLTGIRAFEYDLTHVAKPL